MFLYHIYILLYMNNDIFFYLLKFAVVDLKLDIYPGRHLINNI